MPLLENFRPVLHNFDPFLQFTDQYIPELQAFFANFASATQTKAQDSNFAVNGESRGSQLHFLRTMLVLGPESLAIYTQTDRHEPRQPLLPARRVPSPRQRRAEGVRRRLVRELGAIGERARERNHLPDAD